MKGATAHDQFQFFTAMNKLDTAFAITWLESRCDLTAGELKTVNGKDLDAVPQMVTFETGLQQTLKPSPGMMFKGVALRLLTTLGNELGNRLQQWKAAGGVTADLSLNWKV